MRDRVSWKRRAFWLGVCVLVLLAGWGIYWILDNERLNGEALSVVGTLGAGIFTAVAAVAALGAARQSRDSARDAVEALGLAMEPTLKAYTVLRQVGSGPERRVVVVENKSRWAADDVQVQVTMKDGTTGSHRFERIGPAFQPNPTIEVSPREVYFEIAAASHFPPEDDPQWRGQGVFYDVIIVSYGDERRLLRWQKTCRYEYSYDITAEYGGSEGYSYDEALKRIR